MRICPTHGNARNESWCDIDGCDKPTVKIDALDIEIELPDGSVVSGPDAFEQAEADGFPIACEWFARCENAAAVAMPHPVLTAVPTCNRCAARAA